MGAKVETRRGVTARLRSISLVIRLAEDWRRSWRTSARGATQAVRKSDATKQIVMILYIG